jgi:hypothetical protein
MAPVTTVTFLGSECMPTRPSSPSRSKAATPLLPLARLAQDRSNLRAAPGQGALRASRGGRVSLIRLVVASRSWGNACVSSDLINPANFDI